MSILRRDYGNSDSSISAILRNENVAEHCAVRIRSYVDKEATMWLYAGTKARGAKHKRQFEIAIAGMKAAIALYMEQGNQEVVTNLRRLSIQLSGQLVRCKTAFATKRHGRDRAHSILSECSSYLGEQLGERVTFVTLANLVNAGYEADGKLPEEPVTEEQIRKNLTTFSRNNPLWRNEIDPQLELPSGDQATK